MAELGGLQRMTLNVDVSQKAALLPALSLNFHSTSLDLLSSSLLKLHPLPSSPSPYPAPRLYLHLELPRHVDHDEGRQD